MTFDWERHRFKHLARLGEQARAGGCANVAIPIEWGADLLTLLAEAVQYQEAHAHSQQLRGQAEQRVALLESNMSLLLSAIRFSTLDGILETANIVAAAVGTEVADNEQRIVHVQD